MRDLGEKDGRFHRNWGEIWAKRMRDFIEILMRFGWKVDEIWVKQGLDWGGTGMGLGRDGNGRLHKTLIFSRKRILRKISVFSMNFMVCGRELQFFASFCNKLSEFLTLRFFLDFIQKGGAYGCFHAISRRNHDGVFVGSLRSHVDILVEKHHFRGLRKACWEVEITDFCGLFYAKDIGFCYAWACHYSDSACRLRHKVVQKCDALHCCWLLTWR